MNELVTPLTDAECDRLDRFLLECIDDDVDTLDKDEGVLDISGLDGLFTCPSLSVDKHRGWVATIRVHVVVERNTRSAVCIDAQIAANNALASLHFGKKTNHQIFLSYR